MVFAEMRWECEKILKANFESISESDLMIFITSFLLQMLLKYSIEDTSTRIKKSSASLVTSFKYRAETVLCLLHMVVSVTRL